MQAYEQYGDRSPGPRCSMTGRRTSDGHLQTGLAVEACAANLNPKHLNPPNPKP